VEQNRRDAGDAVALALDVGKAGRLVRYDNFQRVTFLAWNSLGCGTARGAAR
jgi:hypothetical protein